MKRSDFIHVPRKPRQVNQKSRFVGKFLRQPCKTRSGRRYSSARIKSSEERFLGSLVTKEEKRRYAARRRQKKKKRKKRKCYSSSSSSGGGCECTDCEQYDAADSESIRSQHGGLDLLFRPDHGEAKKRKKKLPKKARKNYSTTTCSSCLSGQGLRRKTSKTQLKAKPNYRKRKANKNLSLLKYVLSKTGNKRFSSDSTLHRRDCGLDLNTRCECCGEFFMTLSELENLVPEDLFDCGSKTSKNHISMKRLKSILRAMSARRKITPSGSAGSIGTKSVGLQTCTSSKKKLLKEQASAHKNRRITRSSPRLGRDKPISSILFPSTGVKDILTDDKSGTSKNLSEQNLENLVKMSLLGKELSPLPSAKASDLELQLAMEDELKATPPPSSSQRLPTFIVMIKTAIRDLRPFKITSVEAISKYIELRYRVRNDHLLKYILDWMVDMRVLRAWSGHYYFTKGRLVKKTTVAVLRGAKKQTPVPIKKLRKVEKKETPTQKKARKTKEKKDAKKLWKKGMKNCKAHKTAKFARKWRRKKNHREESSDSEPDENDSEEETAPKSRKTKEKQAAKKRTRKHKHRKQKGANEKKKKHKKKCNTDECTCNKELTSAKNRVKIKTRYVRRRGKIYREEEFV